MRIIVLLLVLCFVSLSALAQTVDVTFSYTPPASQVSGLEIRLSGPSSVPAFDCGTPTSGLCTVPRVPAGSWNAVAVLYNIGVPSSLKMYGPLTAPVPFTVPSVPGNLDGFTIKSIQISLAPTNSR